MVLSGKTGGIHMWKKALKFSIPLIICLVFLLVLLPGCKEETPTTTPTASPTATTPPTKDKIVIGASRPISGPNAAIGDAALGPIMKLWQEKVNGEGGIYVKEYDKKLPVEYIIYEAYLRGQS
jgi:hypothetical protein